MLAKQVFCCFFGMRLNFRQNKIYAQTLTGNRFYVKNALQDALWTWSYLASVALLICMNFQKLGEKTGSKQKKISMLRWRFYLCPSRSPTATFEPRGANDAPFEGISSSLLLKFWQYFVSKAEDFVLVNTREGKRSDGKHVAQTWVRGTLHSSSGELYGTNFLS